ncbi:glycerol-3-phosphate responsive antiterminator [Gehongia tenuis]|uniref:Glycerol-3-phosphate responsive antiterminator n=1 Tax=Gehongia tenuis TaxID=2763655 RepID=A0A926D3Q2_9FIRM|nr:glycerol-3-phosphate responsive antiterminator [Gehongia tenuis]
MTKFDRPVVAAVKDLAAAGRAAASPVRTVFILDGNILTLPDMVGVLQRGGKEVFIHMDLVGGIGRDEAGVRYVARILKPRGILTTRSSLVKCALDAGLVAVQRIFLVDSASLKSGIKQVSAAKPHLVEVMPGLVPRAISALSRELAQPIIAGGMIETLEDAAAALRAGARAISTTSETLWCSKI